MKNITKKLSVTLTLGIVLSLMLGLIGQILMPLSAHPTATITLPGGDTFDNFEIGTDSPITDDYAQSTEWKRRIEAQTDKGSYITSNNGINDSVSFVLPIASGYIVGRFSQALPANGYSTALYKFDSNFKLVKTVYANTVTGDTQYLQLTPIANQGPNQSNYAFITQLGKIVYFDTNLNYLPANTKNNKISRPSGVGFYEGYGTIDKNLRGTGNWNTNTKSTNFYLQRFDNNNNFVNSVTIPKPSPIKTPGAANTMSLLFSSLPNGNYLFQMTENRGINDPINEPYREFWLYNSSFQKVKEIIPVTKNLGTINVLEASANPVISYRDNKGTHLIRLNGTTGNVISEKIFAPEINLGISSVFTPSMSTGNMYVAGNAKAINEFAGYSETGGSVIFEVEETGGTFNLVVANFVEAGVTHTPNYIREHPKDPTQIVVGGNTGVGKSGFDLFPHPAGGLKGGREGFFGVFKQEIDYAPKLPAVPYVNVKLPTTATAAEADSALLGYIRQDMFQGTADIETNRLDDFTSNDMLFGRINQNIYNPTPTAIDWSKFGLTAIPNSTSYEAGPNEQVTYSVSDDRLNQTTTSTRVNVIDENTLTDDDDNLANATHALHTKDIRVHINDLAALDYLVGSKAKAWDLTTGTIETDQVTYDASQVKKAVGVYPIEYTYGNIVKGNQVIVYDDDSHFGPEDTEPLNEKNTEMIYAKGGQYRKSQATGKTVDELTGYQAWNLTDGSDIATKTTAVTDGSGNPITFDPETEGKYYVTYTLASGTTAEIIIEIIPGDNPVIDRDPLWVSLPVNAPQPNKMAGVTAHDTEDGDLTADITHSGTINTAVKGVYPVQYVVTDSDDNTTIETRPYVVGYVKPPVIGSTEGIIGDDFILTEAEAAALTESDAQTRAAATAWNTTTGLPVAITTTDITAVQPVKGVYPVDFTTAKGTTVQVNAIVGYDKEPIIDETTGEAIIADDFKLTLAEAASLTESDAEARAVAKAWNLADNANVPITIKDITAVQAVKGVYPVTFTTAKGTTITVNAIVDYDKDPVVDETTGETIIADDFKLTEAEAAALTPIGAQVRSGVKAWVTDDVTTTVGIATTDISAVQPVKGVYPVEFTTAKGTTIIVDAIVGYDKDPVVDETTGESIIADDFKLTIAQASALTEQDAQTRAAVKAWVTDDVTTEVAITTTDISAVQPVKGVYPVEFKTAKGTTIIVDAIVGYDKDPVVDEANGETIIADDFKLTIAQASALTEQDAQTRAAAKAWETDDVTKDVAITTTDIIEVQPVKGMYPVSFTTAKGTTITVNAIVGYDKDPVVDEATGESIIADDFKLTLDEAAALTEADAETRANAKAWVTDDVTTEVAITTTDITAVQEVKGMYPVTFTTTKGTTITVNAIVGYDKDPVVDEANGESIIADDFKLTIAEASALTETDAQTRADAKAWMTDDVTTAVDITTTDITAVQPVKGIYPVSFTTAKGTTITVNAIVGYDKDPIVDEANGESIIADDFKLTIAEASALTEQDAQTRAKAQAWETDDVTKTVAITTTDITAVQAEKGTYPVTFTTAKGTTITVNAIVGYDRDPIVDEETGESIIADSFELTLDEAAALTETDAELRANAQAWETDDVTKLVAITTTDITAVQAVKGIYPVTFTTAKGTTITVDAIVGYDNPPIVDPVTGESIIADDFELEISEANALTEPEAVARAYAQAWVSVDGTPVDITIIDISQVQGAVGVYPVTFTTAKGTTTTVNANVILDRIYKVSGNNVIMSIHEFNKQTKNDTLEAYILAEADAQGIELTQQVALSPIHADLTNLTTVPVQIGDVKSVELYYDKVATFTGPTTRNSTGHTATATITVTITDGELPITGEQTIEILVIAMFVLGVSMASIIVLLQKRKQRK